MDSSQTPIPRKLLFQQGAWTLELEQLVAIDAHVLRPSTYELRGADAIVGWLRGSGEFRGLVPPTRELFERTARDGDGDGAFEIRNDRWVQVSRVRAVAASSREVERDRAEIEARMGHLEAEIAFLTARVTSAESKVDSLSTLLNSLTNGDLRNLRVAPPVAPQIQERQEPAPVAAAPVQSLAPKSVQEAAPEHQRLMLPHIRNIDQAIKLLVGDKTALTEVPSKKHAQVLADSNWWTVSLLQDDAGETVGCVVSDLEGTIRLGGGMMMLSAGFISEQIRTRTPSEEVQEAISEVFNNVCALLNGIKTNPHVRSSAARQVDFSEGLPPWVNFTNTRLLMDVNDGGWLLVAGR